MVLENGSVELKSRDVRTASIPTMKEENHTEANHTSTPSPSQGRRRPRWLVAVPPVILIIILAGGGFLAWYFLVYRVMVLEPRVQQQYLATITVLNRNFTAQLSSRSSPEFKAEARVLQDAVKNLVKSTYLSWYFNSTAVFAFGEGSVVVYFWLILSVPESLVEKVTPNYVNNSLYAKLKATGNGNTASFEGYLLSIPSLAITECDAKVIDLLKASFDCYRYQWVPSGAPVALRGPNTQRSSCIWHLEAPAGSQLELQIEWLLPDCRDRLAVYDSTAPSDSRLITSLYQCSRLEQVVRLLSSDQWMTVVWKQGLYNYKDPFSLSAQAWPSRACSSVFSLQPVLYVQGRFQTPFYPSYYPPDTKCTWTFTVPSLDFGLILEFEGYELSKANYNQACTQGQWVIQNRRLCGTRTLQPYAERLYLVSTSVTVTMTSEVSLTGPGLQVHYSLFNQSEPCPGKFLCTVNGLCVPACDGIRDCPNGLDERNCVCTAQYRCPEDSQCLDYFKLCDDHVDCHDGMDEEDCTAGVHCTEMTYKCADGTCIKKSNPECDFVTDCPDASDERHCDCGLPHFPSRVVGGLHSSEGEWPWQASLQFRGQHLCGGVLISSQWVASAAHCFYDDSFYSANVWTVYLGKLLLNRSSQSEEALRVKEIHLHQYYDDDTHDYDLALLRLERHVSSRTLAQPACLPPPTHLLEPGLLCWVTGWGSLKEGGPVSNVLQKVGVRLISEDVCNKSYGYRITPRMLCAGFRDGGKDACQGDSGGPLVCQESSGRWFLAGVVSWGIGCGRPYYYGVYTRITKMTGWIKELTST
ncbi:transmembrane protease serine 6 isoform X1 [Brienomyrus brachyistius]|uniref:transmembrane protease serine 6 isoform X1 n=1 Tax=Brienomyrus brachyistius TaxID=42636 RepID=UPI0020B1DBCE|nr:transmembrane protease serine 6 isoform X1 [Brienomyrus brachyistius]